MQLYLKPHHPLGIMRSLIESSFSGFSCLNVPSPVVSTHQNFDELGFPPDHPGRSVTDTYYINKETVLRTHASAHEIEIFKQGHDMWLLTADVYRRDEIDSSHSPVFHQMDGAQHFATDEASMDALQEENERLGKQLASSNIIIVDNTKVGPTNPYQEGHQPKHAELVVGNMKHSLNRMIYNLFSTRRDGNSEPLRVRWIEAYFLSRVFFQGKWLEILGCGVMKQRTLDFSGLPDRIGWAFGLGLERLAMVLFSIPDIRLFWSNDPRFLSQFTPGEITTFKPYSKYPPCYKDHKIVHDNDFCDVVRDVARNLVEDVKKIDEFVHPKTEQTSVCFRINYRSMDRSLSNEEVNKIQAQVSNALVERFQVELR
ncbi:phenylalanyl-tRNA synthetase [Cantharellus anzutake]|uniref:phenylalanyl-tRNA synthetase n=1 Tax=Cantharellus anzutake TaxID=1750568 RepID=UPI001907039D|nr:phenylalanyl-tRNA synthetase [Cantharellus anzutake]KAF8316223.1 phenylalanyl-tRNA synthetase [Cantharellus anzutake]